jgi:hypothetical protein
MLPRDNIFRQVCWLWLKILIDIVIFTPMGMFKWSGVKCSDVRWNGEVGNLNALKPNERVVKCSEGLSDRVYNIIRIYIDHMKFTV